MYREVPKAYNHYSSLFPNNYLDIRDLDDIDTLKSKNELFEKIVSNHKSKELDVKRNIMENRSYHIVGSLLKEYHFGHHAAYLFPEFQLGNTYKADYLVVGNASGGHQFLFVEFENIYGNITIQGGDFGETIRKGINQISDWKMWIEANFCSFIETFQKDTDKQLPKEFFRYDASRIHFTVIAGRRFDFTEKTYVLKRRLFDEQKINLIHYDNLMESSYEIIGKVTY